MVIEVKLNVKETFECSIRSDHNDSVPDSKISVEKPTRIMTRQKIMFDGVDGKDVFNVIPITDSLGQISCVAGRVEVRENGEPFSKTVFFVKKEKDSNKYTLHEKAPVFDMQDPFFCRIKNDCIFGGVEVFGDEKNLSYRTVFYKGKDIDSLEKFAQGPVGMKDIRLIDLGNKIGVFTRPQKERGVRGKIGFFTIDSIDDLAKVKDEQYFYAPLIEHAFSAPLLDDHVLSEEAWFGSNDVFLLKNGNVGVLAHIGYFSNGRQDKRYCSIAFQFNPETREASPINLVALREDFPEGVPKRDDLKKVTIGCGLVRLKGVAELYLNVGDAETYVTLIEDPFSKYENPLEIRK